MHRRTFALSHVVVGLVMLLAGFAVGWLGGSGRIAVVNNLIALAGPGFGASPVMPPDLTDEIAPFWETWNLVEHEFYTREPLDQQRMVRGAIKGMLAALDDPYTVYQEPDLAALTTDYMQGSSGGVGIYLRLGERQVFVDKVLKNTPASRAGLLDGDEIVAIDGEQVAALIGGLDINQANVAVATKIRGPQGSTVQMTMRRGAEPAFEVELTREEIVISSVKSQLLDGRIGYIQITDFKATTTADFDEALRELLPQQPRGLILDLRNNPGGYLTNAQEVLGRLYSGVALYETDRDGTLKALDTIGGPSDARAFDLPLAVLVNGGSASASEIVAGALRDARQQTFLIGEKTFGKGSVQNIHPLSDQGSARITIAHWLTPNKSEINKIGITPPLQVPYSEDPANPAPCVADKRPPEGHSTCGDSQLAAAISVLRDPAAAALLSK
ncbi:MAG TPA: S41 family peptidase [Roseiflexaceae bacterium]|nr:S41 family peptidase [Roseiflexaceae bacterium]